MPRLKRFGSPAVDKVLKKGLPGLGSFKPPKNGMLNRNLQRFVAKRGY